MENKYNCDAYDSGYCYRLARPLTDEEDDMCEECCCAAKLNKDNNTMSDNKTFKIPMPKERKFVRQEPYVDDIGLWTPYSEYVPEGCASNYMLVMTKEMFVMAYNKWIKEG